MVSHCFVLNEKVSHPFLNCVLSCCLNLDVFVAVAFVGHCCVPPCYVPRREPMVSGSEKQAWMAGGKEVWFDDNGAIEAISLAGQSDISSLDLAFHIGEHARV